MICPDCGHENPAGVEGCEDCGQDLTSFDRTMGEFEAHILERPLQDLNPRPAVIVPPEAPVSEAIAKLCEHRIGCVLVGSPENIEGIFSERDVLMRVSDRYDKASSRPVREFMTLDVEDLDVETTIAFALNRMEVGDYRHVPVTRDGRLEGIVSLRDVLHLLSDQYPDLIPA